MLLVVSSARRLEERYGPLGLERIRAALLELEPSLPDPAVPVRVVFPDDPEGSAEFHRAPADLAATSGVAGALRELRQLGYTAVLLVGGDGVIPFQRRSNPVLDRSVDPDVYVLNDQSYAEEAGASVPIGRLPDFEPPDLEGFLALIRGLAARAETEREGVFAVVNADWEEIAWSTLAGHAPVVRRVPAWSARDPEWALQRARLLYFNLHGFSDQVAWRGFDGDTGTWQAALRPRDVTEAGSRGAVVFIENCYGGLVLGRSPANSIALAFLRAGARAVVGSAGLVFGSYLSTTRPQNADRLTRAFVDRALGGEPVGVALEGSRQESLPASPSPFEAKTIRQFLVYGNPLARL